MSNKCPIQGLGVEAKCSTVTQTPVNEHQNLGRLEFLEQPASLELVHPHITEQTYFLVPFFQLCSFSEGTRVLALTSWLPSPLSFLKPWL